MKNSEIKSKTEFSKLLLCTMASKIRIPEYGGRVGSRSTFYILPNMYGRRVATYPFRHLILITFVSLNLKGTFSLSLERE